MVDFNVEEVSRNVHVVRMDASSSDFTWRCLLSSDRHHDNAHTDQKLEKKHLEQVKECGGGIVDVGDLHCAMQGKWDKRSDLTACRPEQQTGRYLDSLVECAADFYAPYAENFITIGRGNHEQSILKQHETDLTERTCERMAHISGEKIHPGGYGGWVRFIFHESSTRRQMVNLKYWHGAGGGGPVTRGVIRTARMAVYLPDAHLVVTGHTHDQWVVPIARERLSQRGEVSLDEQIHIRCGTYKDEYMDGHSGWHIERGGPPKPKGAMWLQFYRDGNQVRFNTTRAK